MKLIFLTFLKMSVEEFREIKGFENYSISNQGRCFNNSTGRIIKGSTLPRGGYKHYLLRKDGKIISRYAHHLVMQAFGETKPGDNYEIDHIDHNPANNSIENLRWVTHSENLKNKTSTKNVLYEYVDDLPDDAMEVTEYGDHEIEDYYFSEEDDSFYFFNGIKYRKLHINHDHEGRAFVNLRDKEDKRLQVMYSKFKRLYDVD